MRKPGSRRHRRHHRRQGNTAANDRRGLGAATSAAPGTKTGGKGKSGPGTSDSEDGVPNACAFPGGGFPRGLGGEEHVQSFPAPPDPPPPPRTPKGLLTCRVPGFRPAEARRAPWAGKGGGFVEEGVDTPRSRGGGAGVHGERKGDGEGGRGKRIEEEEEQESGWKQRRIRGLDQEEVRAVGRKDEKEKDKRKIFSLGPGGEETESLWDFTARNFPLDPGEVGK